MSAMTRVKAIRSALTEMPIEDFKQFAKLIADFDLWDEMEDLLKSQGLTTLLIEVEPLRAIGLRLQEKIATGDLPANLPVIQLCGCNGPVGPRPGPTTPSNPPSSPPGGPDGGGGGDGGERVE